MQLASDGVRSVGRLLPAQPAVAGYFLSLSLVPLLGSLITEPAAMTLAALMLRERVFATYDNVVRYRYDDDGNLTEYAIVRGPLEHVYMRQRWQDGRLVERVEERNAYDADLGEVVAHDVVITWQYRDGRLVSARAEGLGLARHAER